MQYEITGGAFPLVTCTLTSGEQMICDSGAMVWQTPNFNLETKSGGGGAMFKRLLSNESLFQNIYTAQGDARIAFGSLFPGSILPLEVAPGKEYILQKSAFLASELSVKLDMFTNNIGTGIFGGEGLFLQKLSGQGMAFAEIDGSLLAYELAAGQELLVSSGAMAAIESTVQMTFKQVPGLKNKLLGGEGLFNTVLTGPGKVWIQSMPLRSIAAAIAPYINTGN